MSLSKSLLSELKREGANTRKMLALLPPDQFNWQPHAKSMSLMQLGAHIAEIPGMFIAEALASDTLDFAVRKYTPPTAASTEELLNTYDASLQSAIEALEKADDEDLEKIWTMRSGAHVIMTLPVKAVIRFMAINHVIHHRGQLSVFLRLLNVPVPGMYGPSADEAM